MSSVTTEDRLGELLLRWDELRRQGRDLSAGELCADCPQLVDELRRRIEVIRDLEPVLDVEPTHLLPTPGDGGPDGLRSDRRLPNDLHATAVYQPRRFHAQGGLGEVLAARQEELDRTVALKRIRPDKLHEAARRRFLREAAITARLQHPGIVPVYSLGQDDDGPFYTMPFIEGRTLQEAIDTFHGDESLRRDPGRQALEFRSLLQQFIAVCNTIAYAHDRGVVHRDLKPSNIMLGPYGETLVLDWGLAKQLGADDAGGEADGDVPSPSPRHDALTATGAVLGTPQYMSPEQAKGEPVGPASDIFNLGLILHEILTGKPAFDESSFRGADRLKAVREAAIVPPRSRDANPPRALEAICLKALAAQPGNRYPSPRALADDVVRWLADEQVSAYQEGWGQRLMRMARRHRTWAQAGASALVLITIISVFAVIRINAALTLASTNATEAQSQRQRAAQNFGTVLDGVTLLAKRLHDRAPTDTPEMIALRREMADRAMHLIRSFVDEGGDEPTMRLEAMFARRQLAMTLAFLGRNDEAKQAFNKALAMAEQLAADYPTESVYQVQLAQSYFFLAKELLAEHSPMATEEFRRAERAYRRGAVLAQDNAIALNHLAWFLVDCPDVQLRDPDHAIEWAERARAVAQGPDRARVWNTLGVAYYRKHDWQNAITALDMACKLRPAGGNDDDFFFLAMAYWKLGDRPRAYWWYNYGVRWLEQSRSRSRETSEPYAEASSLLDRSG